MVTMTQNNSILMPKIALYEPDIPQNTASIIRTCSCLGVFLEIIEPCGFIISDKRFKRIVMDYMDTNKIQFFKSEKEFFKSKINERVILMTTKSKKIYTKFKFKNTDTILFGRESFGVPEHVHEKVNVRLTIPMIKEKRSLNLSTSVSMVLGEQIRQFNQY